MNETRKLAEQHVLESQLHLRQIDELIERARQARAKAPPVSGLEALLTETQQHRDKLAHHLDEVLRRPGDALPGQVEHGKNLKGALEATGLQLEKVLASVLA